jgi:hypothetical protein
MLYTPRICKGEQRIVELPTVDFDYIVGVGSPEISTCGKAKKLYGKGV